MKREREYATRSPVRQRMVSASVSIVNDTSARSIIIRKPAIAVMPVILNTAVNP